MDDETTKDIPLRCTFHSLVSSDVPFHGFKLPMSVTVKPPALAIVAANVCLGATQRGFVEAFAENIARHVIPGECDRRYSIAPTSGWRVILPQIGNTPDFDHIDSAALTFRLLGCPVRSGSLLWNRWLTLCTNRICACV